MISYLQPELFPTPAPAGPPSRRNLSRTEWLQLLAEPLRLAADGVEVPSWMIKDAARFARRSDDQAWRMFATLVADPTSEARPSYRPPEEVLLRIVRRDGNVALACRELGEEGVALPSLPTVYRGLAEEAGLRLALRFGEDAMKRYLVTHELVIPHRNAAWLADEMKVPVRARVGGQICEDVRLHSYLDGATRRVMSALVTVGPSNATQTAQLFAAGVLGNGASDREAFIGGAPEVVLTDNAEIYKAEPMVNLLRACDSRAEFGEPGIPETHARIERYHHTLQEAFLRGTPGYLKGPRRAGRGGKPGPLRLVPRDPNLLLTVRELTQIVLGAVRQYNSENVHSELGMTPDEAFLADKILLHILPAVGFWDVMGHASRTEYTLEERGVHVHHWYNVSNRAALKGARSVEVRVLPLLDEDRVWYGLNGRYLGEARLHRTLSEQQREADRAENSARVRRATQLLTAADEANLAEAEARVAASAEADDDASTADAGRRRRGSKKAARTARFASKDAYREVHHKAEGAA